MGLKLNIVRILDTVATFSQKDPVLGDFSMKIAEKLNVFNKKVQERGALDPNSVLCTKQAPSPAFFALNQCPKSKDPKSRDYCIFN